MHKHGNQRDSLPLLVEWRASGQKTLRYVAIIEWLNPSSSWSKPRDYIEITLFRQWRRKARTARPKNNTYKRRNILIYYCVFVIPIAITSAKNITVRAEWLCQSGRAPSEPSETPRWKTTPRPAPIRRVALHIAPRSQFRRFFSLCRYPIVNEHCGVVANCDHTSDWVHWVHQQNVNRSGSHMQGCISTRHFVYHIRLCYSHKIRYLIICHALFKYLYICTYCQSGHRC